MYGSRILKMGIQYLSVDSIQTSWQSRARSQSHRAAVSELVVLKTFFVRGRQGNGIRSVDSRDNGFFMHVKAGTFWVDYFKLLCIQGASFRKGMRA